MLTLVGDTEDIDSLSDEKVREIVDTLCVRSFDEFIDKFDPVIYSYYNANNQRVMYTLKKPEFIPSEFLTEIHFNSQNDFCKMLFKLVDAKKNQNLLNVDFKLEKFTELINPDEVIESIKKSRKELRYLYANYIQREDDDPLKKRYLNQLDFVFGKLFIHHKNIMALIKIAIEDIRKRLTSMQDDEATVAPLVLDILGMGEEGELKVIESPKKEMSTSLINLDDNALDTLRGITGIYFDDLNKGNNDYYLKELVLRVFCPLSFSDSADIDVASEVKAYNNYVEFSRRSEQNFIRIIKSLIEKFLGIKLFFEQYPVELNGMRPFLLVTNIKPEMVVKPQNLSRLATYLNTVNAKNDFTNTIWYAIFPNVAFDVKEKVKLTRQRFKGNEENESLDVNTVQTLSSLMQTLADYRVQTFFSFSSHEKNTFNAMITEGISEYIDKIVALLNKPYSEFAIPCFPNFTVIPKEKSSVVLDRKMTLTKDNQAELSKEKQDTMKLWIEGVYIGAAYVAAGIVATYQDPRYLYGCFQQKIDLKMPGVRFDVERDNNFLYIRTTMPKEISGFSNNIKSEIESKPFGFLFSSESFRVNDEFVIDKVLIYKARSLHFNLIESVYEPIYKTQVTTYIQRVLRSFSSDFKQDKIPKFFSGSPNSLFSYWNSKREMFNAIMKLGDDISYKMDNANNICTINISFEGVVKSLEIETARTTAATHI